MRDLLDLFRKIFELDPEEPILEFSGPGDAEDRVLEEIRKVVLR